MQIITVLAENYIALSSVHTSFLSKVDSEDVEVTLVKNLELLLQFLFVIPKELLSQLLCFYDIWKSLTVPSRVNKNRSPHSMNRDLTWEMRVSV